MKRFRPADAFVDESIRGQRYVMAFVLVATRDMPTVRADIRSLAPPSKRLHFHSETTRTRRDALRAIAGMSLEAHIALCVRGNRVSEFRARDACLTEIVRHLQADRVARLTIESRSNDRDDRQTIERERAPDPTLTYVHIAGADEPLLWAADAIAWAWGAGGEWRSLIEPVVGSTKEIRL